MDLDEGVRDTGQPLDLRDMSTYLATLDGITPELVNFANGISTRTVQEAYLAGVQSHWLDDRLVTTFGYRLDTQDVWEHAANVWPRTPRGDYLSAWEVDLPRTPNLSVSGVQEPTYTRSAVFPAIRNWKWLDRLSFTYNYSTNFEPSTAARNFQNEPPPPATGVTEDFGIGFSLFEGKLNGRASLYRGGQKYARAGGIANGVASGRWKGVGFGGFVNWQDKAIIGYARDDQNRLDRNIPFLSDKIFNAGLHVSYGRRILGDRVMWKAQINVRNLLNEKYVAIAAAEAVGTNNVPIITAYRMQEPRSVVLTNTFSF